MYFEFKIIEEILLPYEIVVYNFQILSIFLLQNKTPKMTYLLVNPNL